MSEGPVEHLTADILAHGYEPEPEDGHSLLAGQVLNNIFLPSLLLTLLLVFLLPLLLFVLLLWLFLRLVVLGADVEEVLYLEDVAGAGVGADLHQGDGGLTEGLREHLQGGDGGLSLVLLPQVAEAHAQGQIFRVAVLKFISSTL